MYKVMIVDDEPYIRQGLKLLINWQEYGFEICSEADNGMEALDKATIFSPDLIITDIKMPEMGGLAFIKKCQEQLGTVSKYIVLTGFSDFEDARIAMKLGVLDYILKPVDEEELVESLNKIKKELDLKNKKSLTKFNYKVLVSGILKQFINGKIEEIELEKIKKYIPEYENGEFTYIMVQLINWQYSLEHTQADIYEMLKQAKKIILSVIGQDMSMYVLDDNIGYGVLVSEKMLFSHENSLNLMLQRIIDNIFKKMKLQVIVYTGKKVKGMTLVKGSYDTCINTLNKNFFLSRSRIVSYEEIKDIIFNYKFDSSKLIESLMESVEKYNFNKINENIEIICKKLETECLAPEIIKANIATIEFEVIELIINMNGDINKIATSIKNLKFDYMVIYDIKVALKDFCITASKYIYILKGTNKSGLLYKVQEYIDLNYDKDIRLKNISHDFYINTIYLGQIFKKKFGVSFNEYLNSLRIEKAKELIVSKNFNISEISSMVGYNDSNYFISNFKKITNITPFEYGKSV